MTNVAAFHQGLHWLVRKKKLEKELQCCSESKTCDPSIYVMDHPKYIVSNQLEESISALRVKSNLITHQTQSTAANSNLW